MIARKRPELGDWQHIAQRRLVGDHVGGVSILTAIRCILPLCGGTAMRTILSYCQGLSERTFGPGEVLLVEKEKQGVLYILIEGEIEVLKGEFQVTTACEPGAIFGEMSILLDIPHTATVRTLTQSRLHVVERAAEFLKSHTDITYQLAQVLAQRVYSVTTYLVDLKKQYEDRQDHLGMVDEVLETLVHQQIEECSPGSDRDPNTTI
jgi:CRP/FNR family cyclic AMP-dependent transcriptional regulator